jgi:hypothetical protein
MWGGVVISSWVVRGLLCVRPYPGLSATHVWAMFSTACAVQAMLYGLPGFIGA